MVRCETEKSNQLPDLRMCGLKDGPKLESRSKERKTRIGTREAKTRQGSRVGRHYFVDLEDGESKETIKNARRKLEVPMEAAMLCQKGTKKLSSFQETEAKSCESNKIPKTKHACIVGDHESTRERSESSLPKDHEDHITGKGYKSMTHYSLVHKLIPRPQAMKIPDAKAAEEARNDSSMAVGQGQVQKKEGFLEAQRDRKEGPLCFIDGHLSPQERGVGATVSEV